MKLWQMKQLLQLKQSGESILIIVNTMHVFPNHRGCVPK